MNNTDEIFPLIAILGSDRINLGFELFVITFAGVTPSLEVISPLVITNCVSVELKYSFNMVPMEAISLYPSTTTITADFSVILHAPSGLSEGSGNFQTVRFFVNYFILTAQSDAADIHAS